jgi:magnesium transporter
VLTVIGTIFLPLTFMVGVYGMNFEGSEWAMPELRWRYAYPLLWIAMLTLVAVMLWMFKRRGWLGRRRTRGG